LFWTIQLKYTLQTNLLVLYFFQTNQYRASLKVLFIIDFVLTFSYKTGQLLPSVVQITYLGEQKLLGGKESAKGFELVNVINF
jgi:hypothetical protein